MWIFFAGSGKCHLRDTNKEDRGSPVKALDKNFTKFVFVEMSVAAAETLAQRLETHHRAEYVEIWCGDCAEAAQKIQFPKGSLTLTFIDPTIIAHCPFSLIQTLSVTA